ncbi:MAG: LemA family protein [Microscillaceae bacterium]|jgi:LemA protein|nr:LemA family protein [Microscillaceae bacterium]
MANSDEILQAYINKMLNLHSEKRDRPFTAQELKQMALDMGMSEEDWLTSQQDFEAHLKSGQGHIMYENWEDAIKELENAVAFNPNSLEAAYGLAKAYQGRWSQSNAQEDKRQAVKYAELALQLRPGHQPTLKVLDDLREEIQAVEKKQKTRYWLGIGALVGLGLLLFLVYTNLNNAIISRKEEVKKKWAQVENVYQRRADLIPKLVSALKNERSFEQGLVENIRKAHSQVKSTSVSADNLESDSDLRSFQAKQNDLSQALNQLWTRGSAPELKASQAFRDLQVQVEGSENRISVERKKFNESVADYNAFIKQFPNSLLGYKELAYFQIDKDAMKKGGKLDL